MAKYYVIQLADIEYNDETHYIEGYQAVEKNGFLDLEKAKAAAKERLYQMLDWYPLTDLDSVEPAYASGYMKEFLDFKDVKIVEKVSTYGTNSYKYTEFEPPLYEITWREFIDWCNMKGYEWIKHVPQLVHLSEIEFPNPCKQEANAG